MTVDPDDTVQTVACFFTTFTFEKHESNYLQLCMTPLSYTWQ